MELLFDPSPQKDDLTAAIAAKIDPFVQHNPDKSIVLLENCFFPNWTLNRIQQRVKAHYRTLGIPCKALMPTQKSSGGLPCRKNITSGNDKTRKAAAISGGERLLDTLGVQTHKAYFRELERQHDVADALLAAYYVYETPGCLKSIPKKKKNTLAKAQKSKQG